MKSLIVFWLEVMTEKVYCYICREYRLFGMSGFCLTCNCLHDDLR